MSPDRWILNKKKVLRYSLIAVPVIVLGALIAGILVLNTSAFRDFLRSEICKQALERTGAHVEIGALELDWTRLAIDLTNVVVHGDPEASDEPALLQAKRLEVAVRFLPLLRGKLRLRDLILDQPIARLRIDSQGHSNLPVAPQPSTTNGPAEVFDLEIQNCAIHSGEIYYNDLQVPLDAELHDLKFDAGYSWLRAEYIGSFSYDKGRLSARETSPVSHAMQVKFAASRLGLSIDSLVLSSGASSVTLSGRLTNYASPTFSGAYDARLFTAQLAQALRLDSVPVGTLVAAGKFDYEPRETGSFIAGVSLEGSASSDKLSLQTDRGPVEISRVSAGFELRNADLDVKNLAANVFGGSAKANWEMVHLDTSSPASRMDASMRGVSLTNASDALASKGVREIPVTGIVNIDVRASWTASLSNLIAHVRLAVSSPPQKTTSRSTIPLNGLVQADYDGPRNTVSFGQSHLGTASTKLTVGGTLSARRGASSNVTLSVTASDLREITSLASLIQEAMESDRPPTPIPEVGGSATFNARVTGTAKNPRIQGQLAAQNVSVDRSRWRSFSLSLDAAPSEIKIQDGKLSIEPQGQIVFSGSAGLQRWSLPAGGPIGLQATMRNISAADVIDVGRLKYPVGGTISGEASLKGTKEDPEGAATVTLAHGLAWNQAINDLNVKATFHQGDIRSTAELQVPAGTFSTEASYRIATQQYQVKLHGNGINLEKIPAIQRGTPIAGALDLSASATGTIGNPQVEAHLTARKLQIRDQSISGMDAQVTLAHEHAGVTLHAIGVQGSVEGKADVELTGNRYTTARLDARAIPLAAVVANFLPEQSSRVKGQTEIHLTAQGPLESPAQMEVHIEIPTLNAAYGDARMALVHPLRADYRGGTLTLAPTEVQGTGTNLTVGGTIPITSKAVPAVSANGSVDLAVLQKFAPSVRASGQLAIQLSSQGSFLHSGMHGQLQIKDAVFSTETIPVGIERLNAQINLSGDRADIANLAGTAGGGTISVKGFVSYGRKPSFNLALDAESVRIRYPEGLRSVLSGRINMQGNASASTVTGRVLVDRLSFTQAFDLANLSGYFSEDSVASAPSAFESKAKLNVAVQSAQDLNLTSSKLSMGGSANLNVTGTLANPILLGRIVLTNGDVFFLGKRFEVQSGTVEFANPLRTEPVLSMYITTTVEQYNVTLNLSGSLDRLRTNYTSDPALPPADIIHLLAFGNTEEEANMASSSSVATSAESVLAGRVSGQVAGELENFTGISQLTIDPLAIDSQGNPGAQLAIQERVTGSLLLTFSTDVTQTQSQTVELQYQLNKRASVTVLRDQNGGYGIDLRYHKVF
jgi:translocation and assembly module TamB